MWTGGKNKFITCSDFWDKLSSNILKWYECLYIIIKEKSIIAGN